MTIPQPLSADALYQECDIDAFSFDTTAELDGSAQVIGQPRAVEAVRFGMGIDQDGYNIFALGQIGTGRYALVRQSFDEKAATEPVPADWCYVNNFDEPSKPRALRLPPGKAVELRQDVDQLVDEMRTALSAAFESEEYQTRRQEIEEEMREQQEGGLEELQRRAREHNLALLRTPSGLVFAPVRDGEVLSPQEVQALSDEEREAMEGVVETLQEDLQRILRQVPRYQRERRERLRELNREIAGFAINGLLDDLREEYAELPAVVDYLNALQKDVLDNVRNFFQQEGDAQAESADAGSGAMAAQRQENAVLRRYRINVLVSHGDATGAPVIYEDNPTYQNLIGRLEYAAQFGALITDFNLLKPGALHRANGGYLILDARKLLLHPFAYETLKRVLLSGELRIESPAQAYSAISTVSLEPEPIALNVKVALIGEPRIYYLLCASDPEFPSLFKVEADFAERMERTAEAQVEYAHLIAHLVRENNLRPFDRSGVARVIEQSARSVGDTEKLSTQVTGVADLLREADYWAGTQDRDVVSREDVQRAIDARIFRSDRIRALMQEQILRETVLIDTTGETAGQINGLSVLQLGGFAFGKPSRITARVRMGSGNVVDIEREVDLSGPLHAKGVLILSGFLGARYGGDKPLALSASLVFEQSYGGVDGDSASSAELYALLSAISGVPIRQSFAVTGAVNQMGQVQAIGGVNEKIEGFFDVCNARGLTGEQGVLIPSSNVKNLMLRQDVVDAVERGEFHIYAVDHVDQGIELLTGVPAGERDEAGNYPEGSINSLVEKRLSELAKKRSEFGNGGKTGADKSEHGSSDKPDDNSDDEPDVPPDDIPRASLLH